MPWLDQAEVCAASEDVAALNGCLEGACAFSEEETALWKPLVLLIPLRLGLTDINEAYIETLKVSYVWTYWPWLTSLVDFSHSFHSVQVCSCSVKRYRAVCNGSGIHFNEASKLLE